MSKRGLPTTVKMRHDSHYVEDMARTKRSVGRIIPINQIAPNPNQPRVEIGDLTELSSSIKQKGVLEPLLVKPNGDGTWMIIAGERRWRAANLAGLREVPCIELDIDEQSIAEIALIENLQRKDLNIWEEADGLAYLSNRFGYTHEEIAQKIGKSRSTVTESFSIAGLPESIRTKCREAGINTKSTLLEIARQFDEKSMHDFLKTYNKGVASSEIRNKNAKRGKSLTLPNSSEIKSIKAFAQNNKTHTDNIYKYFSDDRSFKLEVTFLNNAASSKKDVLQALKKAFEHIKAEG